MLRTTVPSGGGWMPMAISIASTEACEWTPPQTPHAREVMKTASRGSRPLEISRDADRERARDPRHRVHIDLADVAVARHQAVDVRLALFVGHRDVGTG